MSADSLFHTLAKPSGSRCNLDCSYCFYLDKERLYPGARMRMRDEVMESWLTQQVRAFANEAVVPIAWQGGEPTLMGLDFFRRATRVLRGLLRPGQRAEQSLQTNGVLLDEEWAKFLHDEDFLVGLSIDGPAPMHDAFRLDKAGGTTHARVLRAARLLQDHQVQTNAMTCVHSANQHHPEAVYEHLVEELGFRYVQLIPIVEPGPPLSPRSVQPEAWGRFLIATFDRWVRRDIGRVFFPTFEAALANWMKLTPAMCVFRPTCGDALALEHNGDLYSCDHFVDPAHHLGNLMDSPLESLARSAAQRDFGRAKADLPAQCQRCEVLHACRGECPKNRVTPSSDGEAGLNYLCAGYKAFFLHIDRPMRLLAEQLQEGRPVEAVMPLLAALEGAELPRHAPCPCGSGRKLRRCHGAAG